MKSFVENTTPRESFHSTSSSLVSEESIDTLVSNVLNSVNSFGYKINSNRTENGFYWKHLLFFGPLILFLILFISSICIFFIIQRRGQTKIDEGIKFDEQFPDDDFLPRFCAISIANRSKLFVQNELKCGLNRSSIFRMYYSNNQHWIKPGENLTQYDVSNTPKVFFNWKFLSKFYTKSFVLILLDPNLIPVYGPFVILHWIRYYSSSLEDKEDICSYRYMNKRSLSNSQRIVLLYATNSSRMMLRAKTICNIYGDWFSLDEYIHFAQLKLIASTYFLMIFVEESNESFEFH